MTFLRDDLGGLRGREVVQRRFAPRYEHRLAFWFSRCSQFTRIGHVPGGGAATFAGGWPD